MSSFSKLGLSVEITETLDGIGYNEPTPIQEQAIPIALTGSDMLAAAQTGTGKTAAFMLPSLQRLKQYATSSASPAMHPVRMLVLTPTRELAEQINQNTNSYIKRLNLRHTVIYGGVNIEPQKQALQKGCEVVIATVGRLLDHIEQKNIQLNKIEIIVLDEADRMLDMGFIGDVRKIIAMLPEKRQILLFSATFAPEIKRLADDFMVSPKYVETATQNITSQNVEQHIIAVDSYRRQNLLEQILLNLNISQAIVFCKTKLSVNAVTRELLKKNIAAAALHGDKTQTTRTETLNSFKNGETRILVATDVAARGLDIFELPFVINYEMPTQAEDYVHRIGRTGRAGHLGVAISLIDSYEYKMYEEIMQLTGQNLKIEKIEGFEPKWLDNPNSTSSRFDKSKYIEDKRKNNEIASKCERIPGRVRPIRNKKQNVCALLLPNFGIKQK